MSHPVTEVQSIDLNIANQFLIALTGSADTQMTWQTFPDPEKLKGDKSLSKTFTNTLRGCIGKLTQLNMDGAGIFFTVQNTNGHGRSKANITSYRALFVDFDEATPTEWHLQPSIIVKSGGKGKVSSKSTCHAYWVLDEPIQLAEVEFKALTARLLSTYPGFGADKQCNDITRVLRLPGSYHQKANPVLVEMLYSNGERYSLAQIMEGISELVEEKAKAVTSSSKAVTTSQDFDKMLAFYSKQLTECKEGGRNATLNNAAFTLSGLGLDKVGIIRSALTIAGTDCGLSLSEIEATLDSAITKGASKPIQLNGSNQQTKLLSIDAGKLLADEVLANFKYDTEAGQWLEYDGKGKWNPVKSAKVFKLSQDFLTQVGVLITSSYYLNDAIRFAQSYVQVDGWSEISSLHYIPFSNGVLDVIANSFLPHSPDYGFTWQLPRPYSPTAGNWDNIDKFLDSLSNGNPELKGLAIAFANAVLKGRSDLQKFLYLFGSGANGKGAFMTLLSMLIGYENIHSTNMAELNGNRFESANLKGKRLVLMSDEDKRPGGVGVFKAATGGDSIRFEQKGKDASSFIFKGVVVVAANNPTFVGNVDGGIKRRKVDFPCSATVAEKDRKYMTPLFDADLTTFTTYLLTLEDSWVTQVIRNASSIVAVKELGKELAVREDSVAAFMATIEVKAKEGAKTRELYKAYSLFCQSEGLKAKSAVNFVPSFIELCKAEGIEVTNNRSKTGKYLLGAVIEVPEEYRPN